MMYSLYRKILFLLALGMVWSQWGEGEVHAEIFPVTPSNIQENIDGLPADTPDAQKPKSLQAILNELDDDAEDEDTLEFAPGEYENVGELLITKPVILRADGDVTFKGKILINVKSSNVQVRGFKFMNVTVPDAVTMSMSDTDTNADGTQPLVLGFPGKTVRQFLTDLGFTNLPTPLVAGTHVDNNFPVYDDSLYATADPAALVAEGGCKTDTETGCTSDRQPQIANRFTGKKIHYVLSSGSFTTVPDISTGALSSATVKNMLGTIWVDSWSSTTSCPAATGTPPAEPALIKDVVIRNNMFDGTELTAVRVGAGAERYSLVAPAVDIIVASRASCKAELDIIGNRFVNIGSTGSFVKTMPGGTIDATDADGNRVADVGNLEPAILFRNVSRAEVTDNYISGGNADGISLQETPEGAAINIKNNEIVDTPLSGIVISNSNSPYNDDSKTKIMVMGNRITGTSANSYITVFMEGYQNDWSGALSYSGRRFNSYLGFVQWCRPAYGLSPFALNSETHRTLAGNIMPEIWRATRPEFNFGQSASFFSNFDSDDTTSDGLIRDAANMGKTAVIRINADECINIARVKVQNQPGVSIIGNDLGYSEDMESSGYSRYGIAVEYGSTTVTVTGNNIDYFRENSILNGGNGISVKGNYLTRLPFLGVVPPDGEEYRDTDMVSFDPVETMTGPRDSVINPDEDAPVLGRLGAGAPKLADGKTLTLTFVDEGMLEDNSPAASAFSVMVSSSGGSRVIYDVMTVAVNSNKTVVLTLEGTIDATTGITVSYTKPSSGDVLMDTVGNEVASFSNVAVTVEEPTMPTMPEEPMMPAAAATGDGGCALASAGSAGAGMGMLLLFMLAGLAFIVGRKARRVS